MPGCRLWPALQAGCARSGYRDQAPWTSATIRPPEPPRPRSGDRADGPARRRQVFQLPACFAIGSLDCCRLSRFSRRVLNEAASFSVLPAGPALSDRELTQGKQPPMRPIAVSTDRIRPAERHAFWTEAICRSFANVETRPLGTATVSGHFEFVEIGQAKLVR